MITEKERVDFWITMDRARLLTVSVRVLDLFLEYAQANLKPADVFTFEQLRQWAKENPAIQYGETE